MSHFPQKRKRKRKKKGASYSCGDVQRKRFLRRGFVYISVHAHVSACTPTPAAVCVRGRFDAFLSGPAPFALFVFNDASREADSRRVERAAFDVSDYDITDVERRSGDPHPPPPLPPFHIPVAHYSERKEGEIDRGGEGKIKYLARTRMRFCSNTTCVAN